MNKNREDDLAKLGLVLMLLLTLLVCSYVVLTGKPFSIDQNGDSLLLRLNNDRIDLYVGKQVTLRVTPIQRLVGYPEFLVYSSYDQYDQNKSTDVYITKEGINLLFFNKVNLSLSEPLIVRGYVEKDRASKSGYKIKVIKTFNK